MDFKVVFYEEFKHIEVEIGKWSIRTDQSVAKGGTGIAPNPGFISLRGGCILHCRHRIRILFPQ